MNLKKLICLSLVAIISLSLSNASHIRAKQENGIMAEKEWQVRKNYIDENIAKLAAIGPEKVEEFFQKNNIKEAEFMVPDVGTRSLPGAIEIRSLNGYVDNTSGKYFVTGYWEWRGASYLDMYAGAVDGVSLSLSQTNYNPATGFIFSSSPANIAVYDQEGTHYPYAASPNKNELSHYS